MHGNGAIQEHSKQKSCLPQESKNWKQDSGLSNLEISKLSRKKNPNSNKHIQTERGSKRERKNLEMTPRQESKGPTEVQTQKTRKKRPRKNDHELEYRHVYYHVKALLKENLRAKIR